jgi:two-component system KDP operon response regulator KdpE
MNSSDKILIVDDEESIRRMLSINLISKGFRVEEAQNAAECMEKLKTFHPQLIILDLGLPDKNGLGVLEEVRGWSKVPIIILTVSDDEETKVKLLEAGADDYITKPFSIPELTARVNVALRHGLRTAEASPLFASDDLYVDLNQRLIKVKDKKVHLTSTEFNLLKTLIKGRGQVVGQDQLLTEIWGKTALENPHYLRIYIGQLRKKLESNPSSPIHILTEPGVGYRIV